MTSFAKSQQLFSAARSIFPGGVNSPVRAFQAVGGTPLFMTRAKGPYMWDADGNRYIDYVGSWGPAILGHAPDKVVAAVTESLQDGFSFGTPCEKETVLAEKVRSLMPNMEMMRFVSSGTEACMSALRVARGYTKRNKLIKFYGCYHGHADMLLVKAGSGIATLGIPGSPGVPEEVVKDTLVAPFNDLAGVRELFERNPRDIAAIIVEPIIGNAGFIRPVDGFLEGLRELCDRYGALYIFDEVMTGFRVGLGGAQELFKIKPDLTTLGKVIGGGMPIGAYGGRREIMEMVAPSGPIYQAGTLSGNPVAMSCGIATLDVLRNDCDFGELASRTEELAVGLQEVARSEGVAMTSDFQGGMFGFTFIDRPILNFAEAQKCNLDLFKSFFHGMLAEGVYFAPSAFEAGFVSFAHSRADIEATLKAAKKVLHSLARSR